MKSIQVYHLHLVNGDVIDVFEDYDLKGKNTLISRYSDKNLSDDSVFEVGDMLSGYAYIPKKSILYISTGDVIATHWNERPTRKDTSLYAIAEYILGD